MADWRISREEASSQPRSAGGSAPAPARRRWAVTGLLVLGSTVVWNLATFAFNAVSGRLLPAGSYGVVASAAAILYVATPLVASLETLASKVAARMHVAGAEADLHGLLARTLRRLGLAGLAGFAIAVPLSIPVARFLHAGPSAVLIVSAAVVLMALNATQRGVLQGSMRFERYSLGTVVEGLSRVLVGLAAVLVWRTAPAALSGILVGAACGCAASKLLLRYLPPPDGAETVALTDVESATGSLATLVTVMLLAFALSVDVFAAKHYLPAAAAGAYAALSLVGKTVFFATSSLMFVVFPRFCARAESGKPQLRLLAAALALVSAAAAALAAFNYLAPHALMGMLYGHRYATHGSTVALASLAFAAYALLYCECLFLVANDSRGCTAVVALAVVSQAIGVYRFHSTFLAIVRVDLVTFTVAAAALAVLALRAARTSPSRIAIVTEFA
jgi:O-antigen/teichoic acid export membrane protein